LIPIRKRVLFFARVIRADLGPRPPRGRRDAFKVLVGALISTRTRDKVTGEAARRVLSLSDTPAGMARLGTASIARAIYPAGFWRTKARHLKSLASVLAREHGGKVPRNMRDLLALPGVGPKVAALTLAEGHGIPAICVDVHVQRISNRLGLVCAGTPETSRKGLEEILPRRLWSEWNRLLVPFGQRRCGRRPRCAGCPARSRCRMGRKWGTIPRHKLRETRAGGKS
jgi:endonuclease-3